MSVFCPKTNPHLAHEDGSEHVVRSRLYAMNTLSFKDPELFRQQAFIAGQWVESDSGSQFEVNNPATNEVLARVPLMGGSETRRAIEAAKNAWPSWRRKTAKERGAILRKWSDLMLANLDDLATLMTAEQGKPFAESKGKSLTLPLLLSGLRRKESGPIEKPFRRRGATGGYSF